MLLWKAGRDAPARRKNRSSEKKRSTWWTTRNQSPCAEALMRALKRLIFTATERPSGVRSTDHARAKTTNRGLPGWCGMPMMWAVAMYSEVSQKAIVGARVSA